MILVIPLWILAILSFFMAFIIAYLAIPLIHYAAWINGLFAGLNDRTSHTHQIPLFGGVAVFAAFILTTITLAEPYFDPKFIYILAGLIIIFIAGIKDDLTVSKPRKKLLGQILVTIYISVLADIRISSLYEFLKIGDIPWILSIVLTMFVLLVIINGFNLIDGIDGLASGVGILISFVLGFWFFLTRNFSYTIVSFALAGSLIAFFYFNVFSKKCKLFLGDAGSLILGLILGIMVVRFLQLEQYVNGIAVIKSTPAFAISLFIVPLFDTLRVFTIRILQGKSPFSADKQHIHHRLLELGLSHLQATLTLLFINLAMIIICYLFQDMGTLFLVGILFVLSVLLTQILLLLVRKRISRDPKLNGPLLLK